MTRPFHFRRRASSLVVLIAGLAGPAHSLSAQERTDSVLIKRETPAWSVGSIEVQLGVAQLGLGDLNSLLAANGLPVFPKDAGSIALSSHARFGRWLIGGTGETTQQRNASPGWINRTWLGSATVDGGVVLIDAPHFLVYPTVSLGIRRTSLHMEQSGDFTYAAGVTDPARGVTLSSLSAVAGVGLVSELHLSTRLTGPFSIGVRVRYVAPLGGASTSAGEADVSGAPRENGGRYLQLSVGKPIGRRKSAASILSAILLPMSTR